MANPVPFSSSAISADNTAAGARWTFNWQAIKANEPAYGIADAVETTQGPALQREIVDAQSTGDAFTEHLKTVIARGALFRDGVQTAAFTGSAVAGRDDGWL